MAKLSEVSHPQVVINILSNLFRDSKGLQEVDWITQPILRTNTRLARLPFGMIYVVQRDQEEFASPNRYRNRLQVEIDIVAALDEVGSDERRLHFYEQIIEDIIIRNVQIPDQEDSLPSNMSWELMRYLGSDYDDDQNSERALDEMVISLEVFYVRTVV